MLKIHVVDSVKGGCGKSTYCLLLADYINKKGRKPYIIDLDIHGTSWYKDKRRYYEEKGERFRFINDLVQDKSNLSGNYIMHLRIARDIDGVNCEEYKIPICVADPSRANSIQEEQLDIFEYTVATIIEHIFFNEGKKDDTQGTEATEATEPVVSDSAEISDTDAEEASTEVPEDDVPF